MTIEEFGQLVKSKQPSFQNLSDKDAGEAVIRKYPQYRARITTPKPQGRIRETFGDVKQTFSNIKSNFSRAGERISESAEATKRGEQSLGRGLAQSVGLSFGAGSKSIGDVFSGGVKTVLSQQQENALKGKVTGGVQKALPTLKKADEVVGSPVSSFIEKYNNLDENKKRDVDALFGVSQFALDMAGFGVGKKTVTAVSRPIKEGLESTSGLFREAGAVSKEIAEGTAGAIKSKVRPQPSPLKAVGEVLQGKTRDIKTGVKALSEVSTEGVKTFKDLSTNIQKRIGELKKQVTEGLGVDKTLTKIKDLVIKQTTKAGKVVESNPVETGLRQLKELYTKIGDKLRATEVDELLDEAKKFGLSKTDINNIAKTYGIEFGQKAFSKLGEPLTSINAQLFENTRKALKEVARSGITGDAAKLADETMGKLINTKKLIDKNVEAVAKLTNKIRERGILESTGHLISKFSDVLTGGALRGAIGGLLPRGAGYKTLNALDLEKYLESNLKIIKDAINAKTNKEIIEILKKKPMIKKDVTNPIIVPPKGKGVIPTLAQEAKKFKTADSKLIEKAKTK